MEHAYRGAWSSPLYQRNRRAILAARPVSCWRCGKPFTAEDPCTAGHVVPLAEGGTDELVNLRPEHESCNKRAGRAQQEAAPAWRPFDVPEPPRVRLFA